MIKNKYKKLIAVAAIAATMGSFTIGYSNSVKVYAAETTIQESTAEKEAKGERVFGKVTSIDDSKITINVLECNKPADKAKANDGTDKKTPPEKPVEDNNADKKPMPKQSDSNSTEKKLPPQKSVKDNSNTDKQVPPEKCADGQKNMQKPQGKMQDMFTETDDEKTIEINDDIKLVTGHGQNAEEASVSDIEEGTMLSVLYDEDGNIKEISIMQEHSKDKVNNTIDEETSTDTTTAEDSSITDTSEEDSSTEDTSETQDNTTDAYETTEETADDTSVEA